MDLPISYDTGKYIFMALLCLPILVMCIKAFSDMFGFISDINMRSRERQELKKARAAEERREAERRRRFEAQYMKERGGRH